MSSATVEQLRDAIDSGVKETKFEFTHFEIVKISNGHVVHVNATKFRDEACEAVRGLGDTGMFYPVYRGPGETQFPDDVKVLNYLKHGRFVGIGKRSQNLEGNSAGMGAKRDWSR